jgi:hypothetical protein
MKEKYGHERAHLFALLKKEECSTYLQYKKQSNKVPGRLKDLHEQCAHCVKWMTRPSPTASPTAIDDEGRDGISDGDRKKHRVRINWMLWIALKD